MAAAATLTANAQVKKLVHIEQYTIVTDDAGNETKTLANSGTMNYYDADGVLVMDQSSYNRNFYEYNADGTVAKKTGCSWSASTGWTASDYSTYTYEYDAEGNMVKQTSAAGSGTQYSGYEHGQYSKMENIDATGNVTYTAIFQNTFNEAGQLIQREQMQANADGTMYAFLRLTYTYNANGTVATENQDYLNQDGTPMATNWYKKVFSYNADGTLDHYRQQSASRYCEQTSDYVYVYATYDAAWVVQNITAEAGANNTVSLKWDNVDGATGYNVIYDQQVVTVADNAYTTATLLDGSHDFYVQAIVGGEAKNISAATTVDVKDAGKLPAQNFTIVGVEPGENDWGGIVYNTSIQFTLPETTSTITGYKLYYGEGNYDCVSFSDPTIENGVATATVQLSQYSVSDYDSETYEYVPRSEVALKVVITYASGDAEPSNVKKWNFLDNEPIADPEPPTPNKFDIDGDGMITVNDITTLITIYLSLGE